MMSPDIMDIPDDARAALLRGDKREAVRCLQTAHGLGLQEAKDLLEAMDEPMPEGDVRSDTAHLGTGAQVGVARRSMLIPGVILVMLVLDAVVWFLWR